MSPKAKIIEFPKFTKIIDKHLYRAETKDGNYKGFLKIILPFGVFVCEEAIAIIPHKEIFQTMRIIEDVSKKNIISFNIEVSETKQLILCVRIKSG